MYWDYRRKDQLLPFEKLSDDYEWFFIFFRYQKDDPVAGLNNRLYWSDYKSPYNLLRAIKPDGIIFSDLSSIYAVSLNIAAKNTKVISFLLEHGVKLDYDYYLRAETYLRAAATHTRQREKINSLLFYLRSFKFKNLSSLYKFITLPYKLILLKSDKAFAKSKFFLRCPDKYLLFSQQNFPYYQYRDGISSDDVIYFGNPYLDDYIKVLNSKTEYGGEPYYLLIDEGLIEIFGITGGQKNAFIQKLNEFAKRMGCRLRVKLHPLDYGKANLYEDANISYLESVDIAELIVNSVGCFAISTSLMIPLIVSNRVIAFRVKGSNIQETLAQFGVKFLDYLSFCPDEIDFSSLRMKDQVKAAFIEQFLYKNDGNAVERLKKILESRYQ